MRKSGYIGFREGLPTAPDVHLLEVAFPELKQGDRIEYAAIAEVIGVQYGEPRWKSITGAWRKKIKTTHQLFFRCENADAFVAMTDTDILGKNPKDLKRIFRIAKKNRGELSTIRSESLRPEAEHKARLIQAIEHDARKARMNQLPKTNVVEPIRLPIKDQA